MGALTPGTTLGPSSASGDPPARASELRFHAERARGSPGASLKAVPSTSLP
jgi:hypothetical protein